MSVFIFGTSPDGFMGRKHGVKPSGAVLGGLCDEDLVCYHLLVVLEVRFGRRAVKVEVYIWHI